MNPNRLVKLRKGCFIISLDFELAWGTRGRPKAAVVGPDLDGTRRAIDGLIELFDEFDIPATWVAVGAMFMGGSQRHPWISDACFDDIPHGNCDTEPHWYAEDILEKLLAMKTRQDIGCHTLTHMFVRDTPESRAQFDLELERSVKLFEQLKLPRPKSFIYPKHFMAHHDLLKKHGFECYRGPEAGWFEQLPTTSLKAAGRLLSARLRQAPSVGLPYKSAEDLWVIPSSQFYPSFRSVGKYVSVADRVAKAIKGLDAAVSQQAVYHLWTHPFNLGLETDALLAGCRQILLHSQRLRETGKLECLSMANLSDRLTEQVEPVA